MNDESKLILEYRANNKLPANLQKKLYPNNVLKEKNTLKYPKY